VSWDGYVEVRGNRYSVPDTLVGQIVVVWIGLDGRLRVYAGEQLAAQHQLRPRSQGWVSAPDHHARLWRDALHVEQRSLEVYEEVSAWKS
jgi:hypothetical protein